MIPEAEPHVAALLDALRVSAQSILTVSLSVAPDDYTTPYVVVHPDPGSVSHARLCGGNDRIVMHFTIHGVGSGAEQALWAGDKARKALLNNRPSVPDRNVFPIVQDGTPPPIRPDRDVEPPLFIDVSEFMFWSDPT